MNKITTFGAALALALAGGAANAATIGTFDVSMSGTISGPVSGTFDGSGTGTLDDSGTLTLNYSSHSTTSYTDMTTDNTDVFSGTWDGVNTLSGTSGTTTSNSCQNNGGAINGCNYLTTGQTNSYDSVSDPIVFDLNMGGTTTFEASRTDSSTGAVSDMNFTLNTTSANVSPVPLPAAAWLFGSSLVGLGGVCRRRRHAA